MLLNLCILILHSATLQNSLTIIIQTVISSANNEEIASFFMILIPLVYFSYLIKLARTFRTMLNWCYNSDHISLFLVLKNMHLIFHYYHDDYGILIRYFPYQIMEISFHFWFKSFILNEYWFLSNFYSYYHIVFYLLI